MLLSPTQFVNLFRRLRRQQVLSLYVGGTVTDPAQRFEWRVAARDVLDQLAETLADRPKGECVAFDRCRALLEAELDQIAAAIRAPGWVGFATVDGVQLSGAIPVPMPTEVRWQPGIWIAPYIRALKQDTPVLLAVLDGRSAIIYRYLGGRLVRLEKLHAVLHGGHADHLGAQSQHFHPGTRGATASELADRARLHARDLLAREVAERLMHLVDPGGGLLVGGIPEAMHAVLRELSPAVRERTLPMPELTLIDTNAELTRAVARAASALRNRRDQTAIHRLVDAAAAGQRATVGVPESLEALAMGEGRELFVTPGFLVQHPAEAEQAIEQAFDQDAGVEVVSGEAAVALDAEGGVGLLLRFAAHRAGRGAAAPSGGAVSSPEA